MAISTGQTQFRSQTDGDNGNVLGGYQCWAAVFAFAHGSVTTISSLVFNLVFKFFAIYEAARASQLSFTVFVYKFTAVCTVFTRRRV